MPKYRTGVTPGGRFYESLRSDKGKTKRTVVDSDSGPYSHVKKTDNGKSKKYRVAQGDGPAPKKIKKGYKSSGNGPINARKK